MTKAPFDQSGLLGQQMLDEHQVLWRLNAPFHLHSGRRSGNPARAELTHESGVLKQLPRDVEHRLGSSLPADKTVSDADSTGLPFVALTSRRGSGSTSQMALRHKRIRISVKAFT